MVKEYQDYVCFFRASTVPVRYRGILEQITVAYETYGTLNAARDNAILVVHGFSANSHAAGHYYGDVAGWWDWAVGPGRPLDSNRYFIVCANNLGSCFGSSGPAERSSRTGQAFGADFPFPTVADIAFGLRELQKEFDIDCWRAVIGGSLGGMVALSWASAFPEQTKMAVCLNAGAQLSCVGAGLLDIQSDLIARSGKTGLQLARRLATLSYLNEGYFRDMQQRLPGWSATEWLSTEAAAFADNFDAHSYRGFLFAMRQFDCRADAGAVLPRIALVGCHEDILFPSTVIQNTAKRFCGARYPEVTLVHSVYGHDSFLLDESLYAPILHKIFAE